jgi:hypothetical protein
VGVPLALPSVRIRGGKDEGCETGGYLVVHVHIEDTVGACPKDNAAVRVVPELVIDGCVRDDLVLPALLYDGLLGVWE